MCTRPPLAIRSTISLVPDQHLLPHLVRASVEHPSQVRSLSRESYEEPSSLDTGVVKLHPPFDLSGFQGCLGDYYASSKGFPWTESRGGMMAYLALSSTVKDPTQRS